MINLPHWEFRDTFSPIEACHLILGDDPAEMGNTTRAHLIVYQRMEKDFKESVNRLWLIVSGFPYSDKLTFPIESGLVPEELKRWSNKYHYEKKNQDVEAWLEGARNEFEHTTLARQEIQRWLGVNSLPSKFNFVKSLPPKTEAIEGEKLFELPAFDADASDYPELLAIALRAWEHARSVSTGTPKQRIMAFLDSNYPHLAKGTKEIIAQVANWNRTGGRPSGD